MKNFIQKSLGFNRLATNHDWLFNLSHLIIVFCVLAFVIFFSMYYFRKKEKRQKIFLILSAVFLLLFEVGRMVWNGLDLKNSGEAITFSGIFEPGLFTVSLWFSIISIFIVAGIGYKKRFSQFLLNYIFTVTAIVAIIDIVYPIGLNSRLNIYHFYNLEFLFSRSIIILIAMFIGSTNWLNNSLDDIWMAILNLIFMIGLGVAIYFASSKSIDIIYLQECPWLTMSGITIKAPWHMFIVGLFFFGMQVMMYLPFDIFRKIKYKTWKPDKF